MIVAKNDEMEGANPEVARAIFKKIDQPKTWMDISGGHFGLLYFPSTLFDESINTQIEFLKEHLIQSTAK